MRGGPRSFPQGFPCPVVLRILLGGASLPPTGLSPSPAGLPRPVPPRPLHLPAVLTPGCPHPGLGSSPFARRYSGNRFFFLFLRLLRCFSSPGSPRTAIRGPAPYSRCGGWGFPSRVSPFRYLRIFAYLQLPAAFRSLSRLSSAPSAKASAPCPFLLNRQLSCCPLFPPSVAVLRFFCVSRHFFLFWYVSIPCTPSGVHL